MVGTNMSYSVNSAFNDFHKNIVNLDSEKTKKARRSRDWLITQLNLFPSKIYDFPEIYSDKHIQFGSFARNTKIRPLDDIDMIYAFSADGTTYREPPFGTTYYLDVPEINTNLRKLCNDDGTLNSIKVVNKIVASLNNVEHYKGAKIHRRQEAATLSLTSYDWVFDIVPAFYTRDNFYIIPDGSGNWKATNPIIDQNNVSTINQYHNGKVLQLIRTLKYWQKRQTMPTISSYLLETIILTFANSQNELSEYIDFTLKDFWNYLKDAIYNSFPDPKGFQGELNNLDFDTQYKISVMANNSYLKANKAIYLETNDNDIEKSINQWGDIFGNDFPSYG